MADVSLAERIAAFAVEDFDRPARVPPPVLEQARQRLLDNIGCMYFGLAVPPAKKTVDLVVAQGRGECPVIGLVQTTSAPAAALAHGILAQSFEMNDLGAYVHAGACVVPACLAALAQTEHPVTGAAFLAAMVAGYEVTVRLAEAIGPAAELDIGWHTPGFHGAVGASVAAGLLLGSDAPVLAQTIAIAADLAGGGLMVARLGSDTKRLHCGRGAETGLMAALLARTGLDARLDALEHGTWGYCRAMAGGKAPAQIEAITDALGTKYVGFDRTAIKYYCVGAEVLGVIDNILKLKRRPGFRVEDVAAITVGTPRFFVLAEAHRFPRSPTETHFNVEYGVAMALLYDVAPVHEAGRALLDRWMTGFEDPRVRDLFGKVCHVVDEDIDRRNPYAVDSRVKIRMRDGTELAEETQYVRKAESMGTMRFAPMDEGRIVRKFGVLTQAALAPGKRDALIQRILGMQAEPEAAVLWRALRA